MTTANRERLGRRTSAGKGMENMTTATAVPDLSRFDTMQKAQEDGIDVQIKDPTGKPVGFSIRISGPDSERQRNAVAKLRDERLQSEDPTPLTAAQIDHNNLRGLAMATIGWSPDPVVDGKHLAYSEDAAVKLYSRYRFIRDQMEARAGGRAFFMSSSSGDSSSQSDGGSKD